MNRAEKKQRLTWRQLRRHPTGPEVLEQSLPSRYTTIDLLLLILYYPIFIRGKHDDYDDDKPVNFGRNF